MEQFNLATAVVAQAERRPDLTVGTADDPIRLADLVALAAGRAHSLLDDRVRAGDPVALVDSTTTDYIVTWFACMLAGAPVALVNPTYPQDLVDEMLTPVAPSLVLRADDVARSRRYGTADVTRLPGLDADRFSAASLMHTSGTTGLPKFCVQTHEYFRRLAGAMAGALRLTPQDRVLAPLPLFHINPMGYGLITALLTGADCLTLRKFSASGFWPTVVDTRVTALVLHAPPVEILKKATAAQDAAGHSVRTMFYADREFLRRFSIPAAVSGYGSTEAAGVSHLRRWTADQDIPPDASRHGGPSRVDVEWRLDLDGTIFVREREPSTLFAGYARDHGVDPARDGDGWFDTGDLGRAEPGPDGEPYLVFLERGAESIRVKGEFVPIPFVENHLAAVPGLRDHALWKRRSGLVDDDVVLYAELADGTDAVPVDALRTSIAQLPAFMRPVAVARVSALPRDAAAGKVQRRLLTDTEVLEWVSLA